MSEMDQIIQTFIEEASELLADLETALIELEKSPRDTELIGRVFRAMHTIKGSGAAVGFDLVAGFAHHVETLLSGVRDGSTPVTKDLIDILLASRDHISAMMDASAGGVDPDPDPDEAEEIIAGIRALLPGGDKHAAITEHPAAGKTHKDADAVPASYHIRFRPPRDIFAKGLDPSSVIEEMRALGDMIVIAQPDDIPLLEDIDPSICHTCWDVVLTTTAGMDGIKDVFMFMEDEGEVTVRMLNETGPSEPEVGHKLIGEILVERGDVTPEEVQRALDSRKRLGEVLVESGALTPSKVEAALAEQKTVESRRAVEKSDTVKVAAQKLDKLINLVGELVITQARLTQVAVGMARPELSGLVEDMERLTAELRDNIMSVRMTPIGAVFSRFTRLARDLSKSSRKEVTLVTEGADTELDKTVVDRLGEALVHIMRNSVDHGIEPPDERMAAGKPRAGTIKLAAVQKGDRAVITVTDDGRGLDEAAIKAKAVEKGLIPPGADIRGHRLLDLIFAPGFSTAKEVSNVSGRGVGLDVVKREVESLRGSVSIESEKGAGVSITISLPLTLAIINGLMIAVGGSRFVLPLSHVDECVELTASDRARAHGRRLVSVRGEIVPYVRLRDAFEIGGFNDDVEHVVIVKVDGRRVGVVVDSVVGEYQTVIKPLGGASRGVEGLSGATILGDGTVALIIDAPRLVAASLREESTLAA